jgi:hypothetical protein
MTFSQDNSSGIIISFVVATFCVSVIFSYYASKRFSRLNKALVYALPFPLLFLGMLVSLLPSAYVAGTVFAFFSLMISIAFAWLVTLPVFYWLNKKQKNSND